MRKKISSFNEKYGRINLKNFCKEFTLMLALMFSTSFFAQTLTFSSASPAVAAATVPIGSTKVPIYSAKIVASGFNGAGANLSAVTFTPSGTFASTDIVKYQFWYNTTNNLSTAINTGSDVPAAGTQVTLNPYNPYLGDGQTWYIWITADIKTTATSGRTLTVRALTSSNFTFSSGAKTGTMSAGGTQTFGSGANLNVSNSSFSNFFYCVGSGPSSTNSRTITGSGLNGTAVTVTAPANFEISTSSTGAFSSSLSLGTATTINTTIYIRMKAGLSAGAYSGILTVSGGGASSENVSLSGNVTNCATCTGTLGTPIVNETFGAGTNPGGALSYISGLTYQAVDCPNDGYYAVRNSTSNCFQLYGSNPPVYGWLSVPEDHTPGDTNGYMLMINAPVSPGPQFYRKTVTGLCSGTNFYFSAWMLNPHKVTTSTLPNITFNIYKSDGTTLIATYNTGGIPLATSATDWKQYGMSFTMPAGESSIVLQISNLTPGGNGSDIFIDDIQFSTCGPTLAASASPTSACVGSPFKLEATASTGYYTNPVYQWQRSADNGVTWTDITGATSLSYNQTEMVVGTFQYRLLASDAGNISNVNCRVISNIVSVVINALPTITGANSVLIGNTITLTGSPTPAASNPWTSSNPSVATVSSTGIITGLSAGTTTITYTNSNGCKATLTITVPPYCYKPAITSGTALDTNHGITALGRAGAKNDNWPMVRKGAWTALESKTKGFVVNRIPTTAQVIAIANPVEGMMVYDVEADCLKINIDGTPSGWKCLNTQTCP